MTQDDALLKHKDDDGVPVEPEWYDAVSSGPLFVCPVTDCNVLALRYLPIIPTVLVNGTEGVGTGNSLYCLRDGGEPSLTTLHAICCFDLYRFLYLCPVVSPDAHHPSTQAPHYRLHRLSTGCGSAHAVCSWLPRRDIH